ncbi:MAG: DUF4923 family protein [Paramuribaculum sp.]|nr:DUF4923 family protein [Paramuribaculum sp.]MDE5920037.1 DUF4923 family protein [Paramuribaculum sp.]
MTKRIIVALVMALSMCGVADLKAQTDLRSLIGGILGTNTAVTLESVAGTWSYDSPAVTFKSDNLLKKAGGAAAATAVEKKLEPYYKTAGLDKMEVTFSPDSTFTMKLGRMSLGGTVEPAAKDSDATMTLCFKLGGKVPMGSMDAYIKRNGKNSIDLTFDVSKLIWIIDKVAAVSGSASAQAMSKILSSYEGITAGFTLRPAAAK